MRYAFCPRKTNVCGTAGAQLRPLLNQNQSLSLLDKLQQSTGDVCYWELRVDLVSFQQSHPVVKLSDVFINVVLTGAENVNVYMAQGNSYKNATNGTEQVLVDPVGYKYPLSSGQSVFVITYPTNQVSNAPSTFNLTYFLSADYYPIRGMDAQLKAEIADDIDVKLFWIFVYIMDALGLSLFMIIGFCLCCCRDFDPDNEFEKRRKRQAKEKKVRDKKAMKERAKEEKMRKKNDTGKKVTKKGTSAGKTKGKGSDDEQQQHEDSYEGLKQKGTAKSGQDAKNKKIKKSLETEIRLKNDKTKHKDEFRMPLLDDDDE